MDNHAEPAAQLADEAADAAPKVDNAVRKSGRTKVEADKKPSGSPVATEVKDEPSTSAPKPPPVSKISATSDTRPVERPANLSKPAGQDAAEKAEPAPKPDLSKADQPRPAAAKLDDVARPMDAGLPGDPAQPQGKGTLAAAAAAMERELKSAGFSVSGSTVVKNSSEEATAGAAPAPAASVPSAPSSAGGTPGSSGSNWSTSAPATSVWGSAGSGSAASSPTSAGSSPGSSWSTPAGGTSSWNSPSPSGAKPAWTASADRTQAAGTAVSQPSFTPASASSGGSVSTDSVTDVAAGLLAGTQLPTVAQPVRPAPDGRSPAGSGDLKSRVSAPFTGTKKKLKQAAPARPASSNGSNGGPVSVKSRTGAVRPPAAQPARQGQPAKSGTAPEVRDAQLVLARIEPWSVMKFSFMISLIGWVALFIVVAVFYFLFSALGVFHSIEQTIGLVTSSKGNPGSNASSWFSAGTVLGFTMIAGAVDVVLITALATFGAAIYNLVTRLSGGIEVTLQEAD